MDTKTNQLILQYVKEHSPRHYADLIEKRCQTVIDKINEIRDMPDDEIPRLVKVELGCPHCNGLCSTCLWDKAAIKYWDLTLKDEIAEVCTLVDFNGHNWNSVYNLVMLKPNYVEIYPFSSWIGSSINNWECKTFQLDPEFDIFNRTMKFLQGHIDWAREDGWGKYNP